MEYKQGIALLNAVVLKYVPYVAVLSQVPFVGGYVSGAVNAVTTNVASWFGYTAPPIEKPEAPEGYYWGNAPYLSVGWNDRTLNKSLAQIRIMLKDPTFNGKMVTAGWFKGLWSVPYVGMTTTKRVLFETKSSKPVAFWGYVMGTNQQEAEFTEIKHFSSDGVIIPIVFDSLMKYSGKPVLETDSRI